MDITESDWESIYTVDISKDTPDDLSIEFEGDVKNVGSTVCHIVNNNTNEGRTLYTTVCEVDKNIISAFLYQVTLRKDLMIDVVCKIPRSIGSAAVIVYLSPEKKNRMKLEKVNQYNKLSHLLQDELDITLHLGLTQAYG